MTGIKKECLIFLSFFLAACSHVDNYLLGKENTPEPSPLKPIEAQAKLVEKWSVPAPAPAKKYLSNDLRPVATDKMVYSAYANGLVQAIDKKSGKIAWSKQLNKRLISGPRLGPGALAFGTEEASLLLINQEDGQLRWEQKVSSEILALAAFTADKVLAKTLDGNLYAFDLYSGKKRWVSEHGAPSFILKASSAPLVLNADLALVGYADGKLDAVELKTGQLLWQKRLGYVSGSSDVERLMDIDADPLIDHMILYVANYQGEVTALSLNNGEFLWRKKASVYKNMAMDSKALYFTDQDDVIWSLNKEDGRVNWKQQALKARGLTAPVLRGNQVLVGDKLGFLHLLAVKDGQLLAHQALPGPLLTAPVVAADNQLYLKIANGQLSHYAFS